MPFFIIPFDQKIVISEIYANLTIENMEIIPGRTRKHPAAQDSPPGAESGARRHRENGWQERPVCSEDREEIRGGPAAGNDLKFRPQFSEVWLMKSVFGEAKIEGQRRKNR